MAEIRNCVTTETNPDGTITEVCTPCESAEMHDNCTCHGCDPIQVSCSSIGDAVCVPIIADELYDAVSTIREDIGTLSNITFYLDSANPSLVNGQLVCIRSIGITYDFIGLAQADPTNSEIVIGGQTFTLTPTSLFDASDGVGGNPVYVFDELNGTITLQPPCCCNTPTQPGIKLRTIERNRAFEVANLRIIATGIIGNTPFTACADTAALIIPGSTIIPLASLGIQNLTFSGKICWPNHRSRMTINDSYITRLGVDCIIPTSNYVAGNVLGAPGSFTANVDLLFIARRVLYASHKGAIAVFTTPNATLTKNGEVVGSTLD
ncbi:hypothetical protein [Clostridium sp.]|uniref:hypothetical protein n=1 Tax=Clostridium sp. TaxID=1506 RepID=UPI00261087F4|nr:hypothetical protein [Clostridium sp.]